MLDGKIDTTKTIPHDGKPVESSTAWELVLAFHPRAASVGQRLPLVHGEPLVLGRKQATFGAGVLDDDTLSRRHARLSWRGAGVEIEDLDSRNGTLVNGETVKRHVARHGDVVGIGQLLILVVHGGRSLDRVLAELAKVAPLATTVLLVGETGTAKSHLAAQLHAASGRSVLVTVPCGGLAADLVAHELFGVAEGALPGATARPGLVESAHGGTLLLEGVDDAPPSLQTALLAVLETGQVRRIGATAATRVDVRVIATARSAAPAGLRPEFLSRLGHFVVRVPPLRERLDDIPVLARDILGRRQRWLKRPLAQALLRYDYPHNVRELESLLELAVIEAGDKALVDLSPALAQRLGAVDDAPTTGFAAAADGSWFRPPAGARVSLRRRENLARLLGALVAAHRDRPGTALTVAELFEAGWPGERILPQSAAGRVYVALNTLRNLGLRDLLQRADGGYLIERGATLDVHEADGTMTARAEAPAVAALGPTSRPRG